LAVQARNGFAPAASSSSAVAGSAPGSITLEAARDLGLAEGTAVTVLVKASEVSLAVE
jgi:molybdopterin-binding protein